MSIKVLIVDDEMLERALIRKGFKWEEHGFEIIGEADNGKKALEYFKQGAIPDIVLTDINMPVMDGLSFAETVLKEYPSSHIIIITGYREFDYAQRALKIGVKDFILKPVSFVDIEQTVTNIKNEIEEDRQFSEELLNLKTRDVQSRQIVLTNDFNKIIDDKISDSEILDVLKKSSLEQFTNGCICAVMRCQSAVSDTAVMEKLNLELLGFLENQDIKAYFLSNNNDIILYDTKDKNDAIYETAENCVGFISESSGYDIDYSVSDVFYGNEGIRKSYLQAVSSLKDEKVKKYNRIIRSAMDYIDENLSNAELNLKAVAGAVFVNESYLSRIFRQETGERLIEYITRKRIELSQKLLKTTDLKSYEVAEAVGINNPHYFSLCFKKLVGKTVTEYKNEE